MKRFARPDEHEAVVAIPEVVGVTVVAIEPAIAVVVIHLEDVEVTVRVGSV